MDARYVKGLEGWARVRVEPDKHHKGVFIATKGRRSLLFTKSMVPSADKIHILFQDEDGIQVEYRACNPYSSKLAAAMYRGIASIWIKPGARVLYLGTPSGETLSHVSDVIGPNGVVYAMTCSIKNVKRLVNMAARRPNVIPIIEDPRHPEKYRTLAHLLYNAVFCHINFATSSFLFTSIKDIWLSWFSSLNVFLSVCS